MAGVVLCLSSAFEFRFHLEKFAFRVLLSKCVRIYVFFSREWYSFHVWMISPCRDAWESQAQINNQTIFFKFVFVFNTSAAITLKPLLIWWVEWRRQEEDWKVITSNENSSGSSEKANVYHLILQIWSCLRTQQAASRIKFLLVYRMNKL